MSKHLLEKRTPGLFPFILPNFRAVSIVTVLGLVSALLVSLGAANASSTSQEYDFENPGDLENNFTIIRGAESTIQVTRESGWGISSSGAIRIDMPDRNILPGEKRSLILASKTRYTVNASPDGSEYTFSMYARAFLNGYAGMGFSATPDNTRGGIYSDILTPVDALGASFHGGGFVVHNGGTASDDLQGSWQTGTGSITVVRAALCSDFVAPDTSTSNRSCASASGWYRFDLTLTKVSASVFNMEIGVFKSSNTGTVAATADVITRINGLSNTAIGTAADVSSFLSFTGHRFPAVDVYSITLSGGPTFVAPPAAPSGGSSSADSVPAPSIKPLPPSSGQSSKQLAPGDNVQVSGSNLGGISSAFIGNRRIQILQPTPTGFSFKIPKLKQGWHTLQVFTATGFVTFERYLQVADANASSIAVPGFAVNSSALTQGMRQRIRSLLAQNSSATSIEITGVTMGPVRPSDRRLAMNRARATREFIRSINPDVTFLALKTRTESRPLGTLRQAVIRFNSAK